MNINTQTLEAFPVQVVGGLHSTSSTLTRKSFRFRCFSVYTKCLDQNTDSVRYQDTGYQVEFIELLNAEQKSARII